MQQVPAVGLDLPLKVLVLEDEQEKTWMLYNDPGYILQRYGLDRGGAERSAAALALLEVAAGMP